MKVSVVDFKKALALFEAEFISAVKPPFMQFLAGAVIAASGGKVDAMLKPYTDEQGLIDVDAIKGVVEAGLKHSGDNMEVPLDFGVFGKSGVKLSRADFDKFFTQTLPSVSPSAI